jgi:hypothetical protein
MALLTGEYIERGFVRKSDGSLAVTTRTVDSAYSRGFQRDPDGRLVIRNG